MLGFLFSRFGFNAKINKPWNADFLSGGLEKMALPFFKQQPKRPGAKPGGVSLEEAKKIQAKLDDEARLAGRVVGPKRGSYVELSLPQRKNIAALLLNRKLGAVPVPLDRLRPLSGAGNVPFNQLSPQTLRVLVMSAKAEKLKKTP